MNNSELQPNLTTAFQVQAWVSFGVSVAATAAGIAYLPASGWIRGFLVLGLLYVVTSSFTLSKCIRDQQEISQVVHRVDKARLDRILTEHDPFKTGV